MALWRDRLAGQQLLLVLDDAASSEQVRPLLPGAGGCLVLVTSRRHLTALDDAHSDQPGHPAARRGRRAAGPARGPGRAEPGRSGGGRDHPAVRLPAAGDRDGGPPAAPPPRLVRWPGGPPSWPRRVDRLELMATENLSVAAAFNLSYADLTETSSGCSGGSGCTPAPTSTPTPPPPWTAPIWRPPAAAWRPCTTSTCSPSRPRAGTGCTT